MSWTWLAFLQYSAHHIYKHFGTPLKKKTQFSVLSAKKPLGKIKYSLAKVFRVLGSGVEWLPEDQGV